MYLDKFDAELNEVARLIRKNDDATLQRLVAVLVEEAEAGDEDSQGLLALAKAEYGSLQGWFRSKWFHQDEPLVQEAWNETLFRVFTRITSYVSDGRPFMSWVYNQARFAALDILRRERNQLRIPDKLKVWSQDYEPETDWVMTRREEDAKRRALAGLTSQEQLLLEFHFVQGMTYDQIFDELHERIPREQLRVYVARAVKRFVAAYEVELRRQQRT